MPSHMHPSIGCLQPAPPHAVAPRTHAIMHRMCSYRADVHIIHPSLCPASRSATHRTIPVLNYTSVRSVLVSYVWHPLQRTHVMTPYR